MAQSILEESKKAKSGFFGKLFRNKTLLLIIIVAAVAGGSYYYYTQQNKNQAAVVTPTKTTVRRETLKISTSSSGKVVAKDGVALSFPVSGNLEVSNVYVKEGDQVKKGDKIAAVKTQSLEFDLQNAYASYQSALANYNSKKIPPTQNEIKNSQASIDQAQISLDQSNISLEQSKSTVAQSINNAQIALQTATNNLKLFQDTGDSQIIRDAYVSEVNTIKSIDISVQRTLSDSDSIVGVDNTSINQNFKSVLGVEDASSLNNAKASYTATKNLQLSLDSLANNLDSSNYASVDSAAAKADQTLSALQSHLNDMQRLLDTTITSSGLSQSQLDGFKSTVSSNRSNANSLVSSLTNATQAIRNAKSNVDSFQIAYDKAANDLKVAQSQGAQNINTATISVKSRQISLDQAKISYAELMAPAPAVDLASAQSQLTSAAINVDKAKYNMSQATLTAPIDGVVSQLNYKQGDIILSSDTTAKSMATIINNDTLYVEVNIEEGDISKIKVGQTANVTFDAIDNLTLNGDVTFISLTSATNSNGIVTYLVRVAIPEASKNNVREGMTSNVEFITSQAQNVLSVPVAAVRNIAGAPSVEKADGTIAQVVTGFTDGKKVEVISGLSEGDSIVY